MQNIADRTFNELTGVRALAAYMVYFHHFTPAIVFPFLFSIIKEFHTGVTVFFVLSGFLISLKYSEKVALEKNFLFEYFKNRFARIYPTYLLAVILTFIIITLPLSQESLRTKFTHLFLELTFLRGFFNEYKFLGVAQGWTLTVEETFYFLFPFLILISRIKKSKLIFALFGVYLTGGFLYWLGLKHNYHSFFNPIGFVLLYTFFGRATEFFMGMYLARIFLKRKDVNPKIGFPRFTFVGLAGFIGGLIFMSRFQSATADFGVFTWEGIAINNLLLPLVLVIFFYGLITEVSLIKKILGSKVFVLLGKSSYAFYLFHTGVIKTTIIDRISTNWITGFILVIIFSILCYYLFEEPARKIIRKIRLETIGQTILRLRTIPKPNPITAEQ